MRNERDAGDAFVRREKKQAIGDRQSAVIFGGDLKKRTPTKNSENGV